MRFNALAVLVGSTASLALVACGGLDTGKAERNIKNGIQAENGTVINSVDCPANVDEKEGGVFRCTAVAADGRRLAVSVTQTDDSGGIVWRVDGSGTTGATGLTGATGVAGATGAPPTGPTGAPQPAGGGGEDEGPFTTYRNRSPAYSISHPSRWKRKRKAKDVVISFRTRLLHVYADRAKPKTPAKVRSDVADLKGTRKVTRATRTKLRGGNAIKITFERDTSLIMRYVLATGGNLAIVDFSSPAAIVNLSAWRKKVSRMINSFRWR